MRSGASPLSVCIVGREGGCRELTARVAGLAGRWIALDDTKTCIFLATGDWLG